MQGAFQISVTIKPGLLAVFEAKKVSFLNHPGRSDSEADFALRLE